MTEEELRETNPVKWHENQALKGDAYVTGLGLLRTLEEIIEL